MKKQIAQALLLSAVLTSGASITDSFVVADVNTPNSTQASDNQTSATTTASIAFTGGALSLYNVTDKVTFNGDNLDLRDIYLNGATLDNNTTLPANETLNGNVDDFLGQANDQWKVTVASGDWTATGVGASAGSDEGATALNSGAQFILNGTEFSKDGYQYATGNEGQTTLPEMNIGLSIKAGTFLKKGSYSNTLTWDLESSVSSTQA
ncbi:hypothetical protein ACFO26_08425 [Lactococcus nasutitermitis]|uniref:WxL domain-containing protein n=1 Tax=Lactococcus nasutitermitis TaxID=1652957 RepID=A0ABV9JE25_9LACT|nr:hypothetical protein [Lactococcus nasutitermitis]